MAKPTTHAVLICSIVTLVAAAGIAAGIFGSAPILVVILLIPAAVYEAYRTEGFFTKAASAGILAVLIAEIVLILTKYDRDLIQFVPSLKAFAASIDVKLAGPVIIAVLAVMLLRMTAGIYTKWLSIVIFIASLALFHTLDPALMNKFFKFGKTGGTGAIQQNIQQNLQQKIQHGMQGIKK